jgi:polar amino acid transport system substrate-binding protein
MRKFSILFLLVAAAVFLAAQLTEAGSIYDDVKQRGVVRVGSGNTLPPLNYIDSDGEWKGFDIDMGNAIAEKLGVKIERVPVNNKTRIAFLANKRIDLTISCMSHTKSRDEQVDYAEPAYFWTGKVFYAKKGKFKNVADLGGKRIAVNQGSNAYIAGKQEVLKHTGKEPIMVAFQSQSECWLALKQGKVDAWSTDVPVIVGIVRKESVGYELVGPIYSPGLYGIGVAPNDSKWRDTISFVLQEMLQDGTYEKVYTKWFGPDGEFPLPTNSRPRLPEDLFGRNNNYVWPD